MTYQVKDWSTHFENDRSKERDRCSFVCVPNKQHGMGFSYVMAEPDGAMIYGIWQLILGACSQQKRPRNGWLTSNGERAGSPWGVDDLAVKFRRPASEIQRAITVLTSAKVGWLIVVQDADNKQVPINSPPTPDALTTNSLGMEGKGKEENGTEGKEHSMSGLPDRVDLGTKARIILHFLNESAGRNFRELDASLTPIMQRLSEPDVTVEGCKIMVSRQVKLWKGTDMEQYLRPETLFNKTKFNSYWSAKDLPINNPKRAETQQLQETIEVKSL